MNRRKLRVGIAGVGNCASSFVQGVQYYRSATVDSPPPGLMNVELGGYDLGDIDVVAAFDVHAGKMVRDLAEAVLAPPNDTRVFARPAAQVTDHQARELTQRFIDDERPGGAARATVQLAS